jgi:eukaryotic-like serine/threonine-protein kinase
MKTLLVLAAALAAALVTVEPCVAQSMFRGDAARSGVLAGNAPRSAPRVLWSFPTGDKVVSSPVWHEGLVIFGSDDGYVYAVDAKTGRERWKARTGGPVPSTPAVHAGRVYVMSYDGRLHALDAASGLPLWRYATEGERRFEARGLHGSLPRTQTFADPYDVYLSSPVVANGLVLFGSGDGRVRALDAETGALRWAYRAADVVHASPAVADGLVFIGDWGSRLVALDLATGAERWRFQAGVDTLMANQQGFQSSPSVAGGIVFVGCRDSHLYAIDARTGQERWRFATGMSWVVGSPAVRDGIVYFATSDSSKVHALEAASGKPVFEQQGRSYMFASPVLAGDTLLIGLVNGSLDARDAGTGALRWTWRTPAHLANRGAVLTAEGALNSALNFYSSWREALAVGYERQSSVGSIYSTPLVVDGVIYVGSADGRLYALG